MRVAFVCALLPLLVVVFASASTPSESGGSAGDVVLTLTLSSLHPRRLPTKPAMKTTRDNGLLRGETSVEHKMKKAPADRRRQGRLVQHALGKLRGGGGRRGYRLLYQRKSKKETKRFVKVNAVLCFGLLMAMTLVGVTNFVTIANLCVFITWWVAFVEAPLREMLGGKVSVKESGTHDVWEQHYDEEDVTFMKVQRGEDTFEWPEDMICIDVDNGWNEAQTKLLEQIDSEEKATYLLQRRSKTITLKFVPEKSLAPSPSTTVKEKKNEETRAVSFMKQHFLSSPDWRQLRKQPFSMLGAAFSHMDIAHLAGNLSSLWTFADYAEYRLGNFRFALLYLSCVLSSTAFRCWTLGSKEEAIPGLGASGAITGVISWCCISMNLMDGVSLSVEGKQVNPLVFLVAYVLQDALGLLRLNGHKASVVALLLHVVEGQLGLATEEKQSNKKPKENIGYAVHIGGYLGGLIFYGLNHVLNLVQHWMITYNTSQ